MSAKTAAHHSTSELTLQSVNPIENLATFTAPSASQPGTVHEVVYDVLTGETFCSCKASACGHQCWHADLVALAWERSLPMRQVRWLSDDRLVRYGRHAASMVRVYQQRAGRALPFDAEQLVAARAEYVRRQVTTTAAALALAA